MSNHIRSDLLALNPHQTVSIQRVGLGQHQVVIVDDFYQYPEEILKIALSLPYTNRFEIVGNFPGVRARLDHDHRELVKSMSALWGCPLYPFFSPQPVVFQGIKTDNYRLNVGQRQPHIDQDVTAMVYLNPADSCAGGTALYRHGPTGLERVPPIPDATIRQLANQLELSDEFFTSPEGYENFQNSMIFNPLFACRDNRYINDGNEYWELLKLIEMRPNRLMMIDGRCFHSQYIQSGHYNQAFRVNQVLYLSQKRKLP
ncbi:MAG: hypothetical protein NPIRA06_10080 [Nitrospirales bacterium]|nr:MAG: hypothetical protein NPIRA06_10080 [Nitrospirales bacterium]